MPLILDGKKVRDARLEDLKKGIAGLSAKPKLVIIQVGENERSAAYINQKKKFGQAIGVEVEHLKFEEKAAETEIVGQIKKLNEDQSVTGIIVQLPIPSHLSTFRLIDAVSPEKDVDGLTSVNVKKLVVNDPSGFVPATAKGVLSLLDFYEIPVEGRRATVIGRSLIVGKPVTFALLNRNATVSLCHKHTKNLAELSKEADILVVGIGQPKFIKKEFVAPGQVVVDVGINLVSKEKLEEELPGKKLVGDVDFESVKDVVGAISPVPGGVGPMTVLSLFENLLIAAKRQGNQ